MTQQPSYPQPVQPQQRQQLVRRFQFDGGAGSFFMVGLGVTIVYVITLGLALPWCVKTFYKWQTEHTIIDGQRLRFTGSGLGLGFRWLWWWFLCLITLGLYNFWVVPRFTKWAVENQSFAG